MMNMENGKKKLTIYINEEVLKKMKIEAIERGMSLSVLTEMLYRQELEKSVEEVKEDC